MHPAHNYQCRRHCCMMSVPHEATVPVVSLATLQITTLTRLRVVSPNNLSIECTACQQQWMRGNHIRWTQDRGDRGCSPVDDAQSVIISDS